MEKRIIQIPNLTCASCVPRIEQVMRQQEGVIWAVLNFAGGEATIIFDPVVFNAYRFVQIVSLLGIRIVSSDKSFGIPRDGNNKLNPLAELQQWTGVISRPLINNARSLLSSMLYRLLMRG